jgi:lactoylglutathione lyase
VADRAFPVVYAASVPATAAFYERLGFERHFQLPADGEPGYVGLRRGSDEIGVVDRAWPEDQYGRTVGEGVRFELFVYVDGVDRLVEELRTDGAAILREPADMPWGERVAYVLDPDGNPVALAGIATGQIPVYHRNMVRARRHQRLCTVLAFGLLALVAELAGRSLTHRIDLGRHVRSPSYAGADYYPFLLAGVKVGIALLLARLAWRVAKARTAERAARRLVAALGARPADVPRVRLRLSPRLWLTFFAVTALMYLVQTRAEGRAIVDGWLHTSALPVFAVLAVVAALLWGAVQRWLADYELFATRVAEQAKRLARAAAAIVRRPRERAATPPRGLFGLSFESRPPPLAA